MRRGFTLIELLVALAAASALSLSALQIYGHYHRQTLQLTRGYYKDSSELLRNTYGAIPYQKSANPYHRPGALPYSSGATLARDSIPYK